MNYHNLGVTIAILCHENLENVILVNQKTVPTLRYGTQNPFFFMIHLIYFGLPLFP